VEQQPAERGMRSLRGSLALAAEDLAAPATVAAAATGTREGRIMPRHRVNQQRRVVAMNQHRGRVGR
jgi:hypothetical protein